MKREDYIKKATARIFDSRQKRAVTAELEDHIAHRTEALEEIGYDPEQAEAQCVCIAVFAFLGLQQSVAAFLGRCSDAIKFREQWEEGSACEKWRNAMRKKRKYHLRIRSLYDIIGTDTNTFMKGWLACEEAAAKQRRKS